ncbi:MAG: glycosyltransferase family 39 protein [Candidatus Omnitrophica bacterium]|nr:glycosyltransferase family 39 protein [Candidatus Omnitrophota bacterium]
MSNLFKKHIFSILGYTLITLIMTLPLAFNLTTATPSVEVFSPEFKKMTDEYSEIWITWRFKKAIQDRESFFFMNDSFYPIGIDFTIADHTLALSLMVSPILFMTQNPTLAYNLIILLSFILSGYSVYLLANYLTKNKIASFAAGIIFSFSSAKIGHTLAAHPAIISLQWMVLCILFFLKLLDEQKPSNYIFAALFFTLNTLTSYYLAVFLTMFLAIYLLLNLKKIIDKKIVFALLKLSILVLIFHLPLFIRLLQAINTGYFPSDAQVGRYAYYYGADLIGFVIPPFFHPVLKNTVSWFYDSLQGNAWEHTTYIGFSVLFISIYSFCKFRKVRVVKLFGIMSFLFFLFSLGGALWINAKPLTILNKSIAMPHAIFNFIPILDNIRLPARFFLLMMLCLSIVAAWGLKFILEKYRFWAKFAVATVCILILFENMSFPLPLNNLYIPSVYKEIAQDKGKFSLLEIPFCVASGYRVGGHPWTASQLYQTVHKKNLIGGLLGRTPDFVYEYYHRLPVIDSLMRLERNMELEDQKMQFDQYGLRETLSFLDIKYVVIHKEFVDSAAHKYIEQLLTGLATKKYYPDGYIAYKLPELNKDFYNKVDFSRVGSSLYMIKGLMRYPATITMVWADKDSMLAMPIKEKISSTLKLDIFAIKPITVSAAVNNKKAFIFKLAKGTNVKNVPLKKEDLINGPNIIRFKSPSENSWAIKSLEIIRK